MMPTLSVVSLVLLMTGVSQYGAVSINSLKRIQPFLATDNANKVDDTPSVGARWLTLAPVNVAVVAGSTTQITCASNSSSSLNWIFTPFGSSQSITIVSQCVINPDFLGIIVVQGAGFGACYLIILTATRDLAGRYQCSGTDFDPSMSAQLVVIDSRPVCTVNTTDVVMGEGVAISCDVTHSGNLSPMEMIWTEMDGSRVDPEVDVIEFNHSMATIVHVATGIQVPSHNCKVEFMQPTDLTSDATNIPSVYFLYTSTPIPVQYCPNTISINESATGRYPLGSVIACTSNGYPGPGYAWSVAGGDIDDGDVNGQFLTLNDLGNFTFQCTSNVTFRGSTCYIATTVDVTVYPAPISPLNVALETGSTSTLLCKYGDLPLHWALSPASGAAGAIVVSSCQVVPGYEPYYDLEALDDGSCNLIITSVVSFHAGTYTCQDVGAVDMPSSAIVVTLDAPVCTVNTTGDIIAEHDVLRVSCNVSTVGTLTPQFAWTATESGTAINNATTIVGTSYIVSYIEITAYASTAVQSLATVQSFSSRVFFNAPPPSPPPAITNSATNAPDYTSTYSSNVHTVLYGPRGMQIDPTPSGTVYIGDILTCSADGYPEPTIEWEDPITGDVIAGPQINITHAGIWEYRCTASNYINGREYQTSDTFFATAILPTFPVNVAQYAGMNVTLSCRYKTQSVFWMFTPVSGTSSSAIVSDCDAIPIPGTKYSTDRTGGACNLIISGLSGTEAGMYTCQDVSSGTELSRSVQVISLQSDTVCTEIQLDPPPFTPGENPVIIQCRIDYVGNFPPKITWSDRNGDPYTQSIDTTTPTYVTSNINPLVELPVFGPYTATTSFDAPAYNPPPTNTIPDPSTPSYTYSFVSPQHPVVGGDDLTSTPATTTTTEAPPEGTETTASREDTSGVV